MFYYKQMTFVVGTSEVFARIKFSTSPFCLKSTSRRKYTVLNQQGKEGYRVRIVFSGRGYCFGIFPYFSHLIEEGNGKIGKDTDINFLSEEVVKRLFISL